jgi:predicted dehydrogenase
MATRRIALTRRKFLTGTAGAIPLLALPRRAFAADPPSGQVRVAFIGIGWHGLAMLKKYAKYAAAVCDVDGERLREAAGIVEKATGKACPAVHDYRKILDMKDVDAVFLGTPDHWHALQTVHACQAGKDVYCEKPLTHSIAEGRSMVAAARKYNRVVQTGTQQRSAAEFRRACELVRNGHLGKVHTVKAGTPPPGFRGDPNQPDTAPPPDFAYDLWLGPAPQRPYNAKRLHYNFRFYWETGGGQLTNWGAHHLDIVQWAFGHDNGCPLTVEAKAKFRQDKLYETPEWFDITYHYPGGVTVRCGQEYPNGVTFEGDKGTMFVYRGKLESTPADLVKTPPAAADVRLPVSTEHFENWLECVKSRQRPICDVEIGHRSATVCHLGNIAVRTGRKITWDPSREEVVGDADANRYLIRPYRAPWSLG